LGSDNLITEAAGGNVSAQALKEADDKTFQESEVTYIAWSAFLSYKCIYGPVPERVLIALTKMVFDHDFSNMFLQTEVLKQLSSMGRLVVCAGDGAVQSLRNLYVLYKLH